MAPSDVLKILKRDCGQAQQFCCSQNGWYGLCGYQPNGLGQAEENAAELASACHKEDGEQILLERSDILRINRYI